MKRGSGHWVWLLAASVAGASILWSPMFAELEGTGFGDYQQYHHAWEAGRLAIERHGEWPLWNPHECGGITAFGNPDALVLHPLFLLSLLVGTTIALKVFILAHVAAGLAGAFTFARAEIGMSKTAAALVAVAWAGSGFFAWHCGTGHAGFVPFFLLPWLVISFRRSLERPLWAVGVAAVMTLAALGGGVYPFPFFGLVLAFESARALLDPGVRRAVPTALLLAGVLTALAAGVRLLPIVEHLTYFPRDRPGTDAVSLAEVWDMLAIPNHTWPPREVPGHHWVWVEYAAYVGPWIVGGIVAGAFFVRRRGRGLFAGALVFGCLMVGGTTPYTPWMILHRLPVFSSFEIPSRLVVLFLFYATPLAGLALDALRGAIEAARRDALGRAFAAVAALGVAFVAAHDVAANHLAVLGGKWLNPPIEEPPGGPAPRFFLVTLAPFVRTAPIPVRADLPISNVGTGECYSGMAYRGAPGLWGGDVPQVRLAGTTGTIEAWSRTTNTTSATVTLDRPGKVIFNQTASPGWQTSKGRLTVDQGRIAVRLPAGRHALTLRYRPRALAPAIALTLLGLAAIAGLIRLERRGLLAQWTRITVDSPLVLCATATALGYLVLLANVT